MSGFNPKLSHPKSKLLGKNPSVISLVVSRVPISDILSQVSLLTGYHPSNTCLPNSKLTPPLIKATTPNQNLMARIQIPLDALTSRLKLGSRFESVRSQSISTRFANLKPVSEFLDLKRLSKPASFGEVQSRVNYNLGYFSSNYVAVACMLAIYSLLTNLTLLFDIIFLGLGLFGIKKLDGRDLELGFTRLTTSQLYTTLLIITVPLFIWASPISTALWLVGATGVTILGHASFMDKPIDTAFSEEAV